MQKSLGEKIKDARQSCGFTQEKLGDLIGTSKQNISMWEKDRHQPDIDTLENMAEAFNVPFSYFLNKHFVPKSKYVYREYLRYLKEFEIPNTMPSSEDFFFNTLDRYWAGEKLCCDPNTANFVIAWSKSDDKIIRELRAFNEKYNIVDISRL